ncbi:MAG: AI-2E family transporter [bacterium]
MKQYPKSELYFLFALLVCCIVLTFFIFKPFLYVGILALVGATVFHPIYTRLLGMTNDKKGISAFLVTVFVLCLVVIPLGFFAVQMVREATILYSSLATGGLTQASVFLTRVMQNIGREFLGSTQVTFNIDQYIKSGLDFLIQNIGFVFSNVLALLGGGIIFFVSLYYFFKNGENLLDTVQAVSPLRTEYNEKIFTKVRISIVSVVQGSLFVAVLQGLFAGLGFLVCGVPSALLWAGVAMFAALIPGIGTSLVVLPAVAYLYLTGNPIHAIFLLVYGLIVVSLIDNVLKPKLIERGMLIHPFFILLSAIGGIFFFGPIGFLLGPLVLGFLFVILELYSSTQTEFGFDE